MIEWKGLFANTPYSSANNKTQDDAVVGMQDTIYVTGPGYGGYSANVRVHNESGAVVALIPVSGGGGALSAPAPVRILDDSTTYSYSLEVVRGVVPSDDADKIAIRIVGGASKRYPGQGSTLSDGSTSFAGPMRVEGGLVASTTGYIDLMAYPGLALDGATPSDDAFTAAAADSAASGLPILLPLFPVVITVGRLFAGLIGTPGWSKLKIGTGYSYGGGRDYLFGNPHPSQVYNHVTADNFVMRGVSVEITPEGGVENVWFKLSNCKRIDIESCDFLINESPASGCSFDFFSSFSNVTYTRNTYRNYSDAPVGGMWFRNFGGTADPTTICQNIAIEHNLFVHKSADEALTVNGYFGMMRNVSVRHNTFWAPAATNKHPYLMSFSAGGSTANPLGQLHNLKFSDNYIKDSAATVAIVRIGSDNQGKIMRDVISENNLIEIDANGAENVAGFRFLPQLAATSLGETVPNDQGLESQNDTVNSIGATAAIGVYSVWGDVDGLPCTGIARGMKTTGNILNSTLRTKVYGGAHKASGDCHINPVVVSGGVHVSTGAAGVAFDGSAKAIGIIDGARVQGATYATTDTSSATTLPRRRRGVTLMSTHASNAGVESCNNRSTGLNSSITDCQYIGANQTECVQGTHGNIVFRGNFKNGVRETDENILTMTGDLSAVPNTSLIKFSGGTIRTATLVAPSYIDQVITVERTDANTAAHVINGGPATINGAATFALSTAWQVVRLRATSATSWVAG